MSQKYSLHAALAAAAARGSVGDRALPRFVIGMRVSVGVGWGGGKGLVGPITAEISNEHTHTHTHSRSALRDSQLLILLQL